LAFDFYKDELVTEEEIDEAYAKASVAIDELELKNMLRDGSRSDGLCVENQLRCGWLRKARTGQAC